MRQISISDVTMKLVPRRNPDALSFREKIEIAKLLDRLNADVVELSPIQSATIDSLLVKSVALAVKNACVALPVGTDAESVETAWAAVKDARHPRLQVVAPMSPAQMEYFWHKKPDKMLQTIGEIVSACRQKCPEVEFVADDATRAEGDFLYEAIRTALSSGADIVTICDTQGALMPEELVLLLSDVRKNVPEIGGHKLGVLCSDALSMGVAGAMAALRAGADEIKTAVCTDDAPSLRKCAAVLDARGNAMDVAQNLRLTELTRITDQIDRMCRTMHDDNSPFDSIIRSSVEQDDIALSSRDSRTDVLGAVERLGYELTEEDANKVWEAFQRISAKKKTVSARELDSIVASAALQVPPTYRMLHYVVNCGNLISASAHLKLQKGEDILEGICLGDGPIDAAFLAIEQIVGRHYELDDFQIQAVTEGREAMGQTIVRLRSEGKLYSGQGISTDIVGSSIRAYISALNKIAYEEAEA